VNLSDVSTTWLSPHWQTDGGIRIWIAPNCKTSANRIELSNGTRLVTTGETADANHGVAYEEGARLPREPWRRPTHEEVKKLIVDEPPSNMATSVAIVRLNISLEITRDAKSLETKLLETLGGICELGEPLHCIGLRKNPANRTTVTINRDIGRYNGLHVDNWDQVKLYSRQLATNRICINIGKNDRYFLFLPISLMGILRLLSQEIGPQWDPPQRFMYTLIARQFMERFPDVPTVRCRLAPGEAYIAPTENLVHDGSSVGQSNMDEVFTIRGSIRPL